VAASFIQTGRAMSATVHRAAISCHGTLLPKPVLGGIPMPAKADTRPAYRAEVSLAQALAAMPAGVALSRARLSVLAAGASAASLARAAGRISGRFVAPAVGVLPAAPEPNQIRHDRRTWSGSEPRRAARRAPVG